MDVTELNREELDQLKFNLYYETDGWHQRLTDKQRLIVRSVNYVEEIPDQIVYEAYRYIDFTEEDFFCNVNKTENPMAINIKDRLDSIDELDLEISYLENQILKLRDKLVKELNAANDTRTITDTIVLFNDKINDYNLVINIKKDDIICKYKKIMQRVMENSDNE